jgi:hypothetical protein
MNVRQFSLGLYRVTTAAPLTLEQFESLLPVACQRAAVQEERILARAVADLVSR